MMMIFIDQIEGNIPQRRVRSSSGGGGVLPVIMDTEDNEVFIQGIIMIFYNICMCHNYVYRFYY